MTENSFRTQLCEKGQVISKTILGVVVEKTGDVTELYRHLHDCEKCAELGNIEAKNTLMPEKKDDWVPWTTCTIVKDNHVIIAKTLNSHRLVKVDYSQIAHILNGYLYDHRGYWWNKQKERYIASRNGTSILTYDYLFTENGYVIY